jgi:hypothetical protein
VDVPEDTSVNTVILQVLATDADAGTNSKIIYERLNSLYFKMNQVTGEISLSRQLDYDKGRKSFTFTVVAFDSGNPPHHGKAVVRIKLKDVNDNAPKFIKREFHPSYPIAEDEEIGYDGWNSRLMNLGALSFTSLSFIRTTAFP